jgi:predicted PurR-regulated permease PerM
MAETQGSNVVYKAILLAAALLVFGLVFRQLVTLLLAVLVTVIIAIPLAAAADKLETRGVPRQLGALVALLAGVATIALVIALLIPPFVDQTNEFVDKLPALVDDLREKVSDLTGTEPNVLGHRVQDFFQRYTDDPTRLIGPVTAIGLNVAGVIGALILILITSYYMAVRPGPLVDGVQRLWPPPRRPHIRHVMGRLRSAWIGWMFGVGIHMLVQGVLVYIGCRSSASTSPCSSRSSPACSCSSPTSARSPRGSRRSRSRSPTPPARRCSCSRSTWPSSRWRAT